MFKRRKRVNGDVDIIDRTEIYSNRENVYVSTGFYIGCPEMVDRVRKMLDIHQEALEDGVYTKKDVTLVFHVRDPRNTNKSGSKAPSLLTLWEILESHVTVKGFAKYPRVHVYVGPKQLWYKLNHEAENVFSIKHVRSSRI